MTDDVNAKRPRRAGRVLAARLLVRAAAAALCLAVAAAAVLTAPPALARPQAGHPRGHSRRAGHHGGLPPGSVGPPPVPAGQPQPARSAARSWAAGE